MSLHLSRITRHNLLSGLRVQVLDLSAAGDFGWLIECAYFHAANIKLGSYYFAVQPMWSNEANGGTGGCAMKRGTGPAPVPSTA